MGPQKPRHDLATEQQPPPLPERYIRRYRSNKQISEEILWERTAFALRVSPSHLHIRMWGSVQFSSVTQSYPTLCDPMNRSTPGLPVHHKPLESTQTHAYRVGDTIQLSHPLPSPSPPAPNPSEHWGLFQWVNSLHQVAKILEFQL